MNDLRDVIGAILRDITEARRQADDASRDALLEYADDAVLRSFPAPRIDIRDLKIDLRVAVVGVQSQQVEPAARKRAIDQAIDSQSRVLPFPISSEARNLLRTIAATNPTEDAVAKILGQLARTVASRLGTEGRPGAAASTAESLLGTWTESLQKFSRGYVSAVRSLADHKTRNAIQVQVAAADLKDVPAHMISSISLTLDVGGVLPTDGTEG